MDVMDQWWKQDQNVKTKTKAEAGLRAVLTQGHGLCHGPSRLVCCQVSLTSTSLTTWKQRRHLADCEVMFAPTSPMSTAIIDDTSTTSCCTSTSRIHCRLNTITPVFSWTFWATLNRYSESDCAVGHRYFTSALQSARIQKLQMTA